MAGTRLGERLVEAGLASEEWVEEALEAQVVHGGRLGTNLVERFHLDLDEIAHILGEQHGLPPALQEHFDAADPDVQKLLSPELAARWQVVPLGHVVSEQRIAVATRNPLSAEALDELHRALGAELAPAIACELRIFYQLESVYGLARPNRFKRVRQSSSVEVPVVLEQPPEARPPGAPGRERRRFVSTLSDILEPEGQVLGRIQLRRSGPTGAGEPLDPADLDEVLRAIRRATGRDLAGDLVVAHLREGFDRMFEAGMILVVREQTAVGWKGFVRGGGDDAVELVAVPLVAGVACTIADVFASGTPWIGAPRHPEGLDGRLFLALGTAPPAQMAVLPVTIFDRMTCLLYAQGAGLTADLAVHLDTLASALSAAFERLIRAAQR